MHQRIRAGCFNVPMGRKRSPRAAADMRACQNPWQTWHIQDSAESKWLPSKRQNWKNNPKNCAAAAVSRAWRRFSMKGFTCFQGRTQTARCFTASARHCLSLRLDYGPTPAYTASTCTTVMSTVCSWNTNVNMVWAWMLW